MEESGYRLKAVRLDSGDLAYLSIRARKMLDNAGLQYVKIVASNQLNELVIGSLLKEQNASIDLFGIGTEMITGKSDAALDGVYKLAEINGKPKIKISENIEKNTLPGKKQIYRFYDAEGCFFRDAILLHEEKPENIATIYHPIYQEKNTNISHLTYEPLLSPVVENGTVKTKKKSLPDIQKYLLKRAELLPDEHKRFISPHLYKVGISKQLMETRNTLAKQLKTKH